jgi:septal ring factor EnvC (AmiA/AmiB activator)
MSTLLAPSNKVLNKECLFCLLRLPCSITTREAIAMTTSEPSRLDRIEQILERLAVRSEATDQQIASNARAIEANSNAIAETRQTLAELGERLNDSIQDLTGMLITQVEQAAADRAEMRRMIEEMYGNRSNGNGSSEE